MIEKFPLARLFPYGYSGILLVVILSLIKPGLVRCIIDRVDSVTVLLGIFFMGAFIFGIYRYLIGELLLYPLTHYMHNFDDRLRKRDSTNPVQYLRDRGVSSYREAREAYTVIRRELFKKEDRERLDLAHSEIHILYITAVEFAVTCLYLWLKEFPSPPIAHLLVASMPLLIPLLVAILAAMLADIQQHKIEHRLIKYKMPGYELKEFLLNRGYIEKDEVT
jgi:hypothetical protein